MTFYEFVQWCFRDSDSSLWTVVVMIVASHCIARIIKAFRGCTCEEDED